MWDITSRRIKALPTSLLPKQGSSRLKTPTMRPVTCTMPLPMETFLHGHSICKSWRSNRPRQFLSTRLTWPKYGLTRIFRFTRLGEFPNSFLGPTPSADGIWHSDSVSGDVLHCETGDKDNFLQCGEFFRSAPLTPMLTNTELTTLLDKLLALRNSFKNELLRTLLVPRWTMDEWFATRWKVSQQGARKVANVS